MDTPAHPSEPSAPPPVSDPRHATGPEPATVGPAPYEPYRAPEHAHARQGGPRWPWVLGAGLLALGLLFGCCWVASLVSDDIDPFTFSSSGDAIAVITIDSVIANTGSTFDGIATPSAIVDQLTQAAEDDSVKAILLRIDSPGGTVAASEEIAIELSRIDKPTVASIGDVGASGAYMIASQCDEIMGVSTSAVGSIGVIMEIPNVAGLLDDLGVEFQTLTAGEYKDAGSPWRSLTATETALLQQQVDFAYERFIAIVAEGRGMETAEVRELANGLVWSAEQAMEFGLVDSLGTYNDAIDRAAELGGIDGEPDIVTYEPDTSLDFLDLLLGFSTRLDPARALDGSRDQLRHSLPR